MKEFYTWYFKMLLQMEIASAAAIAFAYLFIFISGKESIFPQFWIFIFMPILIGGIALPFLINDHKNALIKNEIQSSEKQKEDEQLQDVIYGLEEKIKEFKTSAECDQAIFSLKSEIDPEYSYDGNFVLKIFEFTEQVLDVERGRREVEDLLKEAKALQ